MDLWTLALSGTSFDQHEIVSSYKSGTVVKYADLEITLPSSIKRADVHREKYTFARETVRLGRNFVIVKIWKGYFVFPRDKKLHFDHSHHVQSERHPIQVGKLLALSETEVEGTDIGRYSFHDFETDTIFGYAPQPHSYPVAVYNGVLWWNIVDKGLVPTFIDLQSHDKIHNRRDRAIYVHDLQFVQCSNPRYLMIKSRNYDTTDTLIDLLTGSATSVQSRSKHDTARTFLGFVNGKFSPRYITSTLGYQYPKELAVDGDGV